MRWIVRIVGTLLVLILLAFAALFFVPAEKIAQLAAERFERATGRALTIGGDIRPTFWPVLGVSTGPVRVANADWASETPMFKAQGLSIGVDAGALIGGEVRVTEVVADAPEILLERGADGRANWEFGGGGGGGEAGASGGAAPAFTLDRGEIRGGAVTYIDHALGETLALTALDMDFALPDWAGAATANVKGQLRGQDFTADVSLAQANAALSGKLTGLTLALRAGAAQVGFDGKAGLSPLMAEGKLDADLGDLAALSRLVGMARPELPQGLGAGLVKAKGDLTLTPEGSVHLRGAGLVLDGNSLSGDVDYGPGAARPKISANLRGGKIDLRGLTGEGGSGGGGGGSGWPKDRIDVSGLGAVDGALALQAEAVELGWMQLGPTQAVVSLEDRRAVIELKKVSAYEGAIAGQVVVNGRGGLSVGGDLVIGGLSMQPLLQDLAGFDRLLAKGDVKLKFLSAGDNVAQLMAGLSGNGSVALGQGEIRGLDIGGMITNLDPGYVGEGAKTIFSGLSGTFTMEGGVVSNKDMALASPVVNVNGRGKVDLGGRSLDYRVVPKVAAVNGLKVPVDISGPWDNLSYKIDVKAATGVDVEEEAKTKIEEKLGIKRKKGESLEDAAKRKAEKKLEREAKKALEGLLGGE
ncbi:AsmA family protein [Neogemmobacter tilapiae]|uniref:Cell envelope biogenesis protein AsmA n=1 Tax=Neogemmobacter tilapiae TaxID=875041 RepID=A0A918WI16_9RHOB|nr:AsmA family protein [Gemmobacter tilapiae]GHC48177.1 cell envelope biogenesis protein AsmA [Gemmobacter tilapiae]